MFGCLDLQRLLPFYWRSPRHQQPGLASCVRGTFDQAGQAASGYLLISRSCDMHDLYCNMYSLRGHLQFCTELINS